jgi:hypothetical protein
LPSEAYLGTLDSLLATENLEEPSSRQKRRKGGLAGIMAIVRDEGPFSRRGDETAQSTVVAAFD